MALDLSHSLFFSTQPPPELDLSSFIEFFDGSFMDCSEDENLSGKYDWGFHSSNWDSKNSHWNGLEKIEKDRCCEPVNDDILARLPVDPFEMDAFTAITGCFEGFEKVFESGSDCCSSMDEAEERVAGGGVFAGLNWVCSSAMRFQSEVNDVKFDELSIPVSGFEVNNGFFDGGFLLNGSMEDFLSYMHVEDPIFEDGVEETEDCSLMDSQGQGDAHEAILYALRFLNIQDLLSVEMVCKGFRDTVRGDNLLWRNIVVTWPLSERLTDDALLKLTSKAEGNVECLRLGGCTKITDAGLKRVLDSNPKMKKLAFSGRSRIKPEGLLCNLRARKLAGTPGLKYLRVSAFYSLTNKHLEELKSLLDVDNRMQVTAHKPRFYRGRQCIFSIEDDDRAIDVETCPKCETPGLVYDCPMESCREKHKGAQLCRGCIICIARCFHCGRCITECDYEETFCLELLCFDCLKNLLNEQERLGDKGFSSKCTFIHPETGYGFCIFG